MATRSKDVEAFDTAPGVRAYALAVQYRGEVEPRLPAGMIGELAAALTLLGAELDGGAGRGGGISDGGRAGAQGGGGAAVAAPVPSLPEAMTAAVALITGIHHAVTGAKAKGEVRRGYGVSAKEVGTEAEAVLAVGEKIVARAQGNPTEALGLGILPADVAALAGALADLKAAEAAAMGKGARVRELSGKERRAAEKRVEEAVGRIAGAGVLAFARDGKVRGEFAGLRAGK
ncbi:MAG: hypothetical protein QM820_65395 [Minicystis sp.]